MNAGVRRTNKPKVMNARKLAAKAVGWLMSRTRGDDLTLFWAWELTPMPVGLPSWRQLWVGTTMALGIDCIAAEYRRKSDLEEERVMARWRMPNTEKP